MKAFLSDLGDLWCRSMHSAPRWPMHGYYECPDCLRRHPVPWANRTIFRVDWNAPRATGKAAVRQET